MSDKINAFFKPNYYEPHTLENFKQYLKKIADIAIRFDKNNVEKVESFYSCIKDAEIQASSTAYIHSERCELTGIAGMLLTGGTSSLLLMKSYEDFLPEKVYLYLLAVGFITTTFVSPIFINACQAVEETINLHNFIQEEYSSLFCECVNSHFDYKLAGMCGELV